MTSSRTGSRTGSPSRSVLITGAGAPHGIGFTTAKLFAQEGDHLFITGHSDRVLERVQELRSIYPEGKIEGMSGDLTDPSFTARLIAEVRSKFGSLDVLVNNAGMTSQLKPAQSDQGGSESAGLAEITHEAWRGAIARNLDSLFFLTKEALQLLRQSSSGRIINIASVTGPVMAMRNEVAYAAAKAAITGFTRALALDEAAQGLTVNCIAPGWIATDSQSAHEGEQGAKTPMQRSGRPEEIASAIFFLASEGAGYMTGQTLVVDGGNSIAEERT